MSALGQKQTSRYVRLMSALPPTADIALRDCHVRLVPKADLQTARKQSRKQPRWDSSFLNVGSGYARVKAGNCL